MQVVSDREANGSVIPMLVKQLDDLSETKDHISMLRVLDLLVRKPSISMRNNNLIERIASQISKNEQSIHETTLVN